MKKHKLNFDIIDITPILLTFENFGLKITGYYQVDNREIVEFEGTYNQLKKWYEEYYNTGESFKEYFNDGWESNPIITRK